MKTSDMREYGIDHDAGVSRCLGNEKLYRRLLTMFLSDDSFARTKAAYESHDSSAVFKGAHELKGAAGSASLTALAEAAGALVEYLRGGGDGEAETAALLESLEAAYARAKEGVTLFLAETEAP